MHTNGATLPAGKIDRSDYDHDMMTIDLPANSLAAGDLVPGLGILDAILETERGTLLLCSGKTAWEHAPDDEIDVNPAMCKRCAMHPTDCRYYNCDSGPIEAVD